MVAQTFGRRLCLAIVPVGILSTFACGDGTIQQVGEPALIQIQLTDAPADQLASAEVWISRVFLQGGGGGGGPVDLFNDPENPRHYDLLDLRDGVVADLTDPVMVDAGVYTQLRLVVDSARVTFIEGFTLRDGSTEASLRVPSGSESGINVQLSEPVNVMEGQLMVLLVDFDVEKNFVFQGPPTNPSGILFTPTLVELGRGPK